MNSAQESDATDRLPSSVPIQINGLLQNASGIPDVLLKFEEPALLTYQASLVPPPAPNPINSFLLLIHPLSGNAKILRDLAAGSNIIGYISFFTRTLMCGHREGLATRIMTATGNAGVAFGFIALLEMLLRDSVNPWIALRACALCLPAIAAAITE
ncbi:unnamed protein product [Dovyalis caffra]|uniref:Uncharacterized protein n=1 Tax=Dovyalis caffra TaxID=77055 RepID=A0AAV1QUB2_9ROSI|nr:unnamed protein product [Dovyalis caffra]